MRIRHCLVKGAVLLSLALLTWAWDHRGDRVGAGARNPCAEPGNLAYNCGFDVFVQRDFGGRSLNVPDGWWYYVLAGNPDFRVSSDTYWGYPSLWLIADGVPFTAGVYQQVPVTAGVAYQADIGWAAPSAPDFERKLGLDPAGGTDPSAPTVIWGRSETSTTRWPDLTVAARATGPVMTLFLWVAHPVSHGVDSIYLDAVGLWPDPSFPTEVPTPVPSPTATRRLPTATPTTPLPTATPTAEPPTATPEPPTATPTATLTPEPPTATPTATATPEPSTDTPEPTATPTRTAVPVLARVARTPLAAPSGVALLETRGDPRAPSGLLYVAGGALLAAVLVLLAVVALWMLGPRRS